ncbi:alkyl hydroperoxide reductase/ Thiol specific antioxidant/ Mal allergen [Paenibacillus curdlanolyticus YK9]|uniref:Alkyl hydroperoxide reductase/ Thiol specific antioxidant/ Mal allergen n=1 Tax=Paenibacillus curdlanolyticus YK9 TaxID=717606 RepID=E0ICC9_9BACL|nr:redoxin domain-containing protein [Paenibacillus curdlanolyticus]EFM09815.1 alkyl hydroperoxide reductase/ Thiol specific antioxidant/ Mal allergen [Paenibacillus curdlanolyticus YK9]
MGKYRKPVQIVIMLGVLLLGGYAIGKALFASGDGRPEIGGQAPNFTLLDLKGQSHQLSDYKGKAVVVNFWGSFCPPCVKEMPEFQRQYDKWGDKSLNILAVNLSEDDLTVQTFVGERNLSYPILRDANRVIERKYGLEQYPTTFFVKPDGTIMDIFVGGMTEKDIDDRIERLLQS